MGIDFFYFYSRKIGCVGLLCNYNYIKYYIIMGPYKSLLELRKLSGGVQSVANDLKTTLQENNYLAPIIHSHTSGPRLEIEIKIIKFYIFGYKLSF